MKMDDVDREERFWGVFVIVMAVITVISLWGLTI